jgi:hypothetical protein
MTAYYEAQHMRTLLFIAFATTAVVATPILAAISQPKPEAGAIALVIASPFGASLDEIINATNVRETYPNRAPLGAFVYLETSQTYDTLVEMGALLVLNGEKILRLC